MTDSGDSDTFARPVPRSAVLDAFGERLRAEPAADPPLPLAVWGPGGLGKTTLLRQLSSELENVTPCAYVDCAELEPEDLPGLLAAVKFFLAAEIPSLGRIWFGRLEVGLSVLDAAIDFTVNHQEAIRQLRARVREHQQHLPDNVDRVLGAVTVDLLGNALPVQSGNTQTALLPPLTGWFARLRSRARGLSEALDWYGHRDEGAGRNPLDVLARLSRRAQSPHQRRFRDQLLVEAFLADLRQAYRPGAVKTEWWNNCVVLLDNVSEGPGQELLELIAAQRNRNRQRRLASEPLLVVMAARRPVPGIDAVPLGLPDFAESELDELTAPIPEDTDRRFGKLVHYVTGGYPAAATALINAQCRTPVDVSDGLEPLLAAETADGSVEDRLRRALVDALLRESDRRPVADEALESLTVCAAARTLADAEQLAERYSHDGLVDAELLFSTGLWDADGPTAGHRLLLTLLRRRLWARTSGSINWREVYRGLADHRRGESDLVGDLYYTLALGDLEPVARRLTELLPDTGVGQPSWTSLVHQVCQAPYPGAAIAAPYDVQIALSKPLADRNPPHLVQVARVVAGLWIVNHAGTGPDRSDLHHQLAGDCESLVPRVDQRADLAKAVEEHRRLKRYWS